LIVGVNEVCRALIWFGALIVALNGTDALTEPLLRLAFTCRPRLPERLRPASAP